MDKVLTTTLLTMAAVVAAIMVINTMIPVLGTSGSSILSSSGAAAEQIKTDVEIIAVHVETSTAWTTSSISVWIKNVGAAEVLAIDLSDVFVQAGTTSFTRYSFQGVGLTAVAADGWTYAIQDGKTSWTPRVTVKVTIAFTGEMGPNGNGIQDYIVKYTTNNSVGDEETFSL